MHLENSYDDVPLQQLQASIHWPKGSFRGYINEDRSLKARVIKHDRLHLLVAGEEAHLPLHLRFEDEYAVAIVQAVLESNPILSKANQQRRDYDGTPDSRIITTDLVRERTIQDVIRFITDELRQEGRNIPESFRQQLSDEFITHYIAVGEAFKKHFTETHGTNYMAMDIHAFLKIPPADLDRTYQESVAEFPTKCLIARR